MIINVMLDIVAQLLGYVVAMLPSWSLSLPSGVTTLIGFLKTLDAFMPVTEGLSVLSLYVTLVSSFTLVKLTKWVVDSILAVIP